MSLDVSLIAVRPTEVYASNITHNLGPMAKAAGIYEELWRPEEIGVSKAADLIEPLTAGLARLKADPAKYEAFNAPNGWGLYKNFVRFVEKYLAACRDNPDATVDADRYPLGLARPRVPPWPACHPGRPGEPDDVA